MAAILPVGVLCFLVHFIWRLLIFDFLCSVCTISSLWCFDLQMPRPPGWCYFMLFKQFIRILYLKDFCSSYRIYAWEDFYEKIISLELLSSCQNYLHLTFIKKYPSYFFHFLIERVSLLLQLFLSYEKVLVL